MKNRLWFCAVVALVACLTFCSVAVADMIGFWPRDDFEISVRFENLSDYPNHDFYLKYGIAPNNPSADFLRLTRLYPNVVTRVVNRGGGRTTELYVQAVPRGQKVEVPTKSPGSDKWLTTRSSSEALQSGPFPGEQLERLKGYTLVFRVHMDADRLELILVDSQAPIPWTWIGLATGVGIAVAGIVWIRRRRGTKRITDSAIN